jgi:hypothetical protein
MVFQGNAARIEPQTRSSKCGPSAKLESVLRHDMTARVTTTVADLVSTASSLSGLGGGQVYVVDGTVQLTGSIILSGLSNITIEFTPGVNIELPKDPSWSYNSQSGGAARSPAVLVSNCQNLKLIGNNALLSQIGPSDTGAWIDGEGIYIADSCQNVEISGFVFSSFGRFDIRVQGYYYDGTNSHSGPCADISIRGNTHLGSGNPVAIGPDGGAIRIDNKQLYLTGTSPQTYTNNTAAPTWLYVSPGAGGSISSIVLNGVTLAVTQGSFKVNPATSVVIHWSTTQPVVVVANSRILIEDESGMGLMFGIDINNAAASIGAPITDVTAKNCDLHILPNSNGAQGITYNVERLLQQDYTERILFEGCRGSGGYYGSQVGDGTAYVRWVDCEFSLSLNEAIHATALEGLIGHNWSWKNCIIRNAGQSNANMHNANQTAINVVIPTTATGGEVLHHLEFAGCAVYDDQMTATIDFAFQIDNAFDALPPTFIDNVWVHDCDFAGPYLQYPVSIVQSGFGAITLTASPIQWTNPSALYGANVEIVGGVVTSVTVAGNSLGITTVPQVVWVPPGALISIAYSTRPTSVSVRMPLSNVKIDRVVGVTPISGRLQLYNPTTGPNVVVVAPGTLGQGVVGPGTTEAAAPGKGTWLWELECTLQVLAYASGSPTLQFVWQDENGTTHTTTMLCSRVDASPEAALSTSLSANGIYTAALKGVRINSAASVPKIQIAGTGVFTIDADGKVTLVGQSN